MDNKKEVSSSRFKGLLVGILFSLLGVVAWVVLGLVLEVTAGIAGALMGILFLNGYTKFNQKDKSAFKYIIAPIIILIEIIFAELLYVYLLCNQLGILFADALSEPAIVNAISADIAIGVLLSALVFVFYAIDMKRKEKMMQEKLNTIETSNENESADDEFEVFEDEDDKKSDTNKTSEDKVVEDEIFEDEIFGDE